MEGVAIEKFYNNYYANQVQTGAGAPRYYRGSTWQKGHGFGSFISSLGNFLKPIGKSLARSGVKALAGVADDILTGVPAKEAAKRRAVREYETMKANVSNKLIHDLGVNPSGKRRKKTVKNKNRKKNRSEAFGRF